MSVIALLLGVLIAVAPVHAGKKKKRPAICKVIDEHETRNLVKCTEIGLPPEDVEECKAAILETGRSLRKEGGC